MRELRPYQKASITAIKNEWNEGHRRTILCLPTGCGKTVVFNTLAKEEADRGKRVLILAHRSELLTQAQDKFDGDTGLIKAETTDIQQVTVGSIQTLARREWRSDMFDIIIVDECHHAVSESYQKFLGQFPNAYVLGCSATLDRLDKKSLAKVFDSVAYEYSLKQAINEGYLCKIQARTIPLEIDLSEVKVSVGDFEVNSIAEALEPYLPQIAENIQKYASDRKTVVFLPLISIAQEFTALLQSRGMNAKEVNGASPDRAEILEWFDKAPKGSVLCNAMLLCLDMETEILTTRGFVGANDLTEDDEVANWNFDGSVFFEKPKEIVHRYLEPTEHMVSVESKRINFRVTNTHRMIVGKGLNGYTWKKISAQDLTNRHKLPAFGVAEPLDIRVEQEQRKVSKHAVVSTVYNLTKAGMPREEARKEAERRKAHAESLRYKDPSELTIDECRFIGFWTADGTRSRLQSGGIEYSVAQSCRYDRIIEWFDGVIERCGYDYLKKRKPPATKTAWDSIRWSFPRGTGSGVQARNGLYPIEPYLNKDGSHLLWGLNEKQFDAFLEGFWYGDGDHHDASNGFPKSLKITNTNRKLLDIVCAIGSARGWNCAMSVIPMKNPKHRTQYGIRMIKGQKHCLSCKTEIKHEAYAPEQVWCVRTTSKNIITRRHGKVTVMGNTEGWDCPSTDCVVVLRPTKARALFTQMVGRGTRLYPGKENLLILDFLWLCQKHNLCKPANLVTDNEEDIKTVTKRTTEAQIDLFEAETDAVEQRKNALAEALRKQRRKKGKLIDPLELFQVLDDIGLTDYEPTFKWEEADATDAQIKTLEKFGIDAEGITKGYACKIMDTCIRRSREGRATVKQVRCLKKFGYTDVPKWSFEQASKKIAALSAVHWQRWRLHD